MVWGLPAAAQAPARLTEPRGFDFAPNGVWRARARQVRQQREAALARNDLVALNAPRANRFNLMAPGQAAFSSMAVTGVLRVPIFLVRYKNSPIGGQGSPQEYFDALLAQTPTLARPFTIRSYYEQISNGSFSVQGVVIGWIQLDSNDTWYEGTQNGLTGSGKVAQLILEAVSRSDTLDFGQFDNDGPDGVPNTSDDDGYVDVALFVHPEQDGACGPPSTNRNIWSHRYFYEGFSLNGAPLPTNDPTHSGSAGFSQTRVSSYTMQSGVGGANACTADEIMAPGTTAHELGHGLGLPDFYDTNFSDADASEGIGHWGLMGSGNYAVPPSPAHMEGFSRLQLGWVTVRDVTTTGTYTLAPYTEGDEILRVVPTGPNARNEYFLIENRQLTGSDSGLAFANPPKGPGLLIWHIDPVQYNSGFFPNRINTGSIHAVALMQADGLGHLRSSVQGVRNRGDAGDPYPGTSGNTTFGLRSNPSVILNDGTLPPFVIDSIRQVVPQGEMAFRFRTGPLSVVSAADTAARVLVRGVPYNVYRDLFTTGDTITVSMDSAHYSADALKQFVFTSWSDGGARTHMATMTAGANLTANATLRSRLLFSTAGTGTISASPTVVSGDYHSHADSVTLTASATGTAAFVGWSGDTSSANPVLVLRMNRPYVLLATFQTALAVVDTVLRGGVMGASYQDTLRVSGGGGSFLYQVVADSGTLPEGLQLAPGGVLTGIPAHDSTYRFVVRVTSGAQTLLLPLRIVVTQPSLARANVINQLTRGGTFLTTAERTYLDLLGNNNGSYDLGDFVAWLDETGSAVTADTMRRIMAGSRP